MCVFFCCGLLDMARSRAELVPWEQRRNEREKDEMYVRQQGGSDKGKDEIYVREYN